MLKLFIDSDIELWHTEVEEMGLGKLLMPYVINGENIPYDFGKGSNPKAFFDAMRKGATPKTSALNEQDYLDAFEPVLKKGDDILYISFSHNLSATFEFMRKVIAQLKEKYPKRTITHVDTLSISAGPIVLVKEAYKLWKAGKKADEIVKFVEKFREDCACYFMVEDLKYLKRGGRVSAAAAVLGTLLNVKPILHISPEGKIVKVGTAKGRKNALNVLLEKVKTNGKNIADYDIHIFHGDCEADALELKAKVQEYAGPDASIIVQAVGPVIGSHAGPGVVGIAFRGTR